jgi:hypothetical protein
MDFDSGAAPGSFTLASSQDNGYRLTTTLLTTLPTAPPSPSGGRIFFAIFAKFDCSGERPQTPSSAESVVDFRVRGNFGSSVVELRHTALASADECAWHEALWRRSLESSRSLFRSA